MSDMFRGRAAVLLDRLGRARAGQAKVELPAVDVDMPHDHANAGTQPVLPSGSATFEHMGCGVESVVVVIESRDMHQPFGGNFNRLAEEPPILHAGDDGVEFVADAIGHIRQQLHLGYFSLGLFGPTFGARAVLPAGLLKEPTR